LTRDSADVLVVGGGPAGSAAAIRLAESGYDTLIVDDPDPAPLRVGETMAPSIRHGLERLGAWRDFEALGSAPSFGNRILWGKGVAESSSFIFSPHGKGWHTDRAAFDRMLLRRAESAGARILERGRVRRLGRDGSRYLARLDGGGRSIAARAVVDASGRSAAISRQVGARRRPVDRLVAAAVRLRCTRSIGGHGLIEATEHGWWFSAPLPGAGAIVMFMTDADICRRMRLSNPARWDAWLAASQASAERVEGAERETGPRIFAAVSQRLDSSAAPGGCVAAGDAALAVDPLSGSGVERALRTGEWAAFAVDRRLGGGRPVEADAAAALDGEFSAYLAERAAIYGAEARWPDSPFWSRRRQ